MNVIVTLLNQKNFPPVVRHSILYIFEIDPAEDPSTHLEMGHPIRKRQRHLTLVL